MMNFIALISLLGSVSSIVAFFVPEKWKSKRFAFAIFVFVVVILSGVIVSQNSKLSRISKISKAATELLNRQESGFTSEGFIQASLTFLEQNKDLYPDSYNRALKLYDNSKANFDSSNNITLAFEMSGLLRGIAILNKTDN